MATNIEIFPEHLSFGCVSQGFVYSLSVSVVNKDRKPQALKVYVKSFEGELNRIRSNFVPMKIAPGVKQNFTLDLIADYPGTSNFEMTIVQGSNGAFETRSVKALVVPLEVFKHVAKSLGLQKRPIYRNGVIVLGAIGGIDESRSVVTAGGASVLSEAMMDDADLDELLDLPIVEGVYFDSRMCLKVDRGLCAVVVDVDWTIEDSILRTKQLREERLDQLQDDGYQTYRAIEKLETERKFGGDLSPDYKRNASLAEFSALSQNILLGNLIEEVTEFGKNLLDTETEEDII